MNYALYAIILASLLFVGMLVLLELGRRAGQRRIAKDAEADLAGIGVIDASVFTLLGLLLAFTFTGAATRFDARRQLIVEETNAIGTAYLRLDLLPAGAQPAIREKFRQYVDTRLAAYRNSDTRAAREGLVRATKVQGEIWTQSVAATRSPDAHIDAAKLLLPALNSMIDITTTQTMATQMHPPAIVFVMLGVLALVSSLLAGYGLAHGRWRNWIHILCFAAVMSVSFYVILDLEFPRLGWIRVDAFDQALVDLRQTMN
jgi:hypothetical protein